MIKSGLLCPACEEVSVRHFELVDGELTVCLACGHQEISAGVDIEAQLDALAAYDGQLAATWREALGL